MENKLSSIESRVEYDLIVLLKYLSKKDKMSLRAYIFGETLPGG